MSEMGLSTPHCVSCIDVRQIPFFCSLCTDPDFLPRLQVDRGAIKFVMQGANIMCPGLTSPGGSIPEDLPEGTICVMVLDRVVF